MGFALDCNYVQGRDSAQEAREHILEVMNQVSDLYRRTFNVSLGIIELEVEDATCPTSTPSDKTWNVGCGSNLSLDERLSRFSQWRGNKGDDGAGLWHLMSACATVCLLVPSSNSIDLAVWRCGSSVTPILLNKSLQYRN
jgi:hypothetical protein